MRFFRASSFTSGAFQTFTRSFPTPSLLAPLSSGVDISDTSIKWLSLAPRQHHFEVAEYGTLDIPPGLVVNGLIKDPKGVAQVLRDARKRVKTLSCAHAALPEEAGYVFTMHIPTNTPRDQIVHMIEFELENRVPLTLAQSVYDFDTVLKSIDGIHDDIAVVVFPKEVSESYSSVFEAAGIELLSLEIEPRSIARAITPRTRPREVVLLVDFGRARTGLAILQSGIPVFTSTVDVGGEHITRAIMQKLNMEYAAAEEFKNEHGIFAEQADVVAAVTSVVATLSDEVMRLYHYFDTRRDEQGERLGVVSRVLLTGGSSNMKGLPEYIAGRIQAETERADMWQNVASFETYIPPIGRRASFGYATAIGLALRSAL